MCLCKSWWRHTASSVSVPLPIHPHPNIPYSHPSALLYSLYVCGLCVQSVLSNFWTPCMLRCAHRRRQCHNPATRGKHAYAHRNRVPLWRDKRAFCGLWPFVVREPWVGRDILLSLAFPSSPRPDPAGGPTSASCRATAPWPDALQTEPVGTV